MTDFPDDILSPTLRERFWSYVERDPCGCLLWIAAKSPAGYGRISIYTDRSTFAHRVAWYLEYGVWPKGELRHSCDTPACCDVQHLTDGTRKENAEDMVARGRSLIGEKNPQSKLTEDRVREARQLWRDGLSLTKIAKKFGMSRDAITEACHGRHWKHVT
jgi:hypothetical protein